MLSFSLRDSFRCSVTWPQSPMSNRPCRVDSSGCLGPVEAGREHRGPEVCNCSIEKVHPHTNTTSLNNTAVMNSVLFD